MTIINITINLIALAHNIISYFHSPTRGVVQKHCFHHDLVLLLTITCLTKYSSASVFLPTLTQLPTCSLHSSVLARRVPYHSTCFVLDPTYTT